MKAHNIFFRLEKFHQPIHGEIILHIWGKLGLELVFPHYLRFPMLVQQSINNLQIFLWGIIYRNYHQEPNRQQQDQSYQQVQVPLASSFLPPVSVQQQPSYHQYDQLCAQQQISPLEQQLPELTSSALAEILPEEDIMEVFSDLQLFPAETEHPAPPPNTLWTGREYENQQGQGYTSSSTPVSVQQQLFFQPQPSSSQQEVHVQQQQQQPQVQTPTPPAPANGDPQITTTAMLDTAMVSNLTESLDLKFINFCQALEANNEESINACFILFIDELEKIKSKLVNEILNWTQQQKKFANGEPMTMTLYNCQSLAGLSMKLALKAVELLKSLSSAFHQELITALHQFEKKLLQATMPFCKQPSRVLLVGEITSMEVHVLAATKDIKIKQKSLKISIINEATYKSIQQNGLEGDHFKILEISGTLETGDETGKKKIRKNVKGQPHLKPHLKYSKETGCYSVDFNYVKVNKDFERKSEKPVSELVTDEKVCILFRLEVQLDDQTFQIWTTSLPIVIIQHSSQRCNGRAIIIHDNAASLPNRVGFQVPDLIPNECVLDIIGTWFQKAVGVPLKEENRQYLGNKLPSSFTENASGEISWSVLTHQKLPKLKFTFLKWVLEAIKLVAAHFKDAWKKGYVRFLSDDDATLLLESCEPGTFILRITESELGGLSLTRLLDSDGKTERRFLFFRTDVNNNKHELVEKLNDPTLLYVYQTATPDGIRVTVTKKGAFPKEYKSYGEMLRRESLKKQGESHPYERAVPVQVVLPAKPNPIPERKDRSASEDSGNASSSNFSDDEEMRTALQRETGEAMDVGN